MSSPGDYLTAPQVGAILGLTGPTITYRSRQGLFPTPDLGAEGGRGNKALWHKHTVEAWLQLREDTIDVYQISEWLGIGVATFYAREKEYPLPEYDLIDGKTRRWRWEKIQEWASQFVEWEEDQ